jgi:senataxin
MNVAITRARSSLFIVGNAPTLERSNETWKGIVNDAKSRSRFREVSISQTSTHLILLNIIQVNVEYFRTPNSPAKTSGSAVSPSKKSTTLKRQLSEKAVAEESAAPVKKSRKDVSEGTKDAGNSTTDTMPPPTNKESPKPVNDRDQGPPPSRPIEVTASHESMKRPTDLVTDEKANNAETSVKKIKDPDKALKALEKRRKQKQNNLFINQGKR